MYQTRLETWKLSWVAHKGLKEGLLTITSSGCFLLQYRGSTSTFGHTSPVTAVAFSETEPRAVDMIFFPINVPIPSAPGCWDLFRSMASMHCPSVCSLYSGLPSPRLFKPALGKEKEGNGLMLVNRLSRIYQERFSIPIQMTWGFPRDQGYLEIHRASKDV